MFKCYIQFDQNEHGTYFTGQVITGRVHITVNKPKKVNGIKLEISGYASAQWKDKHGRKHPHQKKVKGRRKHVYSGREDYIASTIYLVGSEHEQNFIMETGTHTYSFSCPIPVNCPSSFEGAMGHIRYQAKVTYIRSGFSKRTFTVGFTVLKLLDLNQESRLLKAPATNEAMANFCLFASKPVMLKVNIPQSGFVPGQIMQVRANVNNLSNVDCQKLNIYVNLRATYTADTPSLRTTSEKICLVKKYCGPVPRGTIKDYCESLRIPATPPTCEHLSKVVRVSYEVCVVAVMNILMPNPKTVVPITIGNVPLIAAANPLPHVDNVPTTSSCAMQIAEGNEHTQLSEDSEVEESFEELELEESFQEVELPPPTYEEAMFMTTNIADDDVNTVSEVTNFTPRYPVYDVDAMLAANVPDTGDGKKPQKRRRKKKTAETEKAPVESPVEI